MGLFKRLGFSGRASTSNSDAPPESTQRKKSIISLIPLSEVTEASLKVFRQLPAGITHHTYYE